MSERKVVAIEMLQGVKELFAQSGGIACTSEIVSAGCSKTTIASYVRMGELERIAHGVYALKGAIIDEQYVFQLRSPRIVFSHETALWMNDLTDRQPFEWSVTVATGRPLAVALRQDCRCHYVQPHLVDEGVVLLKTEFGHEVRCYNAERTLCDMVRDEKKVGIEELVQGLKFYAERKNKNLPELLRLAALFGVEMEMSRYMGVLS